MKFQSENWRVVVIVAKRHDRHVDRSLTAYSTRVKSFYLIIGHPRSLFRLFKQTL